MTHHFHQRLEPDFPTADHLVAVFSRAPGILAVVQVDGLEAGKADYAVKFLQHAVQVSHNVVARVVDVAGVQADAHAVRALHPVEDGAQGFKGAAHLAALAGHGLQEHRRVLLRAQHLVEGLGDARDARFLTLPHVGAGMEVIECAGQQFQAA